MIIMNSYKDQSGVCVKCGEYWDIFDDLIDITEDDGRIYEHYQCSYCGTRGFDLYEKLFISNNEEG